MRLLFCIKSMSNLGGAERVLADVSRELSLRGHEVAVLSFDHQAAEPVYPLGRATYFRLDIGSSTGRATFVTTLRRIKILRRAVRSYRPDVAIGFMHSMFIPLGLALIGTTIPLIASEHIVHEYYHSRPIEALLLRLTPYLSDRITCVSEQAVFSFPSPLQRKMIVVLNPVTVQTERRADTRGSDGSRKLLLAVGRLEAQKDHMTLIEAFARIADDNPQWDLHVIGEGTLRPDLEAAIAALGLRGRVFLNGTTNDMESAYLSAQLFVSSSRYESFGLTVAEALAHGLPAVGFGDCPGINQLIIPGINGDLAVDRENRSLSLSRSLNSLMRDDNLRARLAKRSAEALNGYCIEDVADTWETLLEQVSRRKSPCSTS